LDHQQHPDAPDAISKVSASSATSAPAPQSQTLVDGAAPRIAVLGSINMDLVFVTPRMPAIGETLAGSGFRQVAGGKGANQAVAAARQGGAVAFIGMIGADAFGSAALRGLAADGIDCAAIGTDDLPTGVAGILVDASGANSIVYVAGANAALSVERVDAAAATIASARWLVCQLETPLASVSRAFDIARAAGVAIVFNPSPAPAALPDSLLAGVDVLVVNETEAAQLSGLHVMHAKSAAAAAAVLRSRGASTVLVTMGAQGVLIADGTDGIDSTDGSDLTGSRFMPALRVEAVDTTAAGDTFVGALTVALGRGAGIDEAVGEAQAAAAFSVTRMGAQSSIPTRAEMLAMRSAAQAQAYPEAGATMAKI
jgi:ribokinase